MKLSSQSSGLTRPLMLRNRREIPSFHFAQLQLIKKLGILDKCLSSANSKPSLPPRIGAGGSASVYEATLRKKPVAAKQFFSDEIDWKELKVNPLASQPSC